jgi:hypothetical protein
MESALPRDERTMVFYLERTLKYEQKPQKETMAAERG